MQHTTLGRTGIQVSVAGLGCGGHSRLGQSYGATEAESIAVDPPRPRPRHQPDRHRAGVRHRVDRGEGDPRPPRRGRAVHQGAAGPQGPPAQAEAPAPVGARRASSGCARITSTSSSCTACRCATSTTPARCSCPSCSRSKEAGLDPAPGRQRGVRVRQRPRLARAEPRRRRRLVRRADGGPQPVQPVGARSRVPGHRGARHRRAGDVRGAQVPRLSRRACVAS